MHLLSDLAHCTRGSFAAPGRLLTESSPNVKCVGRYTMSNLVTPVHIVKSVGI